MPAAKGIRVLIIDDHEMARRGLAAMLGTSHGIRVVGEASSAAAGVAAAQTLRPDVVLLDIRMPGGDGLQALEEIKQLDNPPVVVLMTLYDDSNQLAAGVRMGASGYLVKDATRAEVVATVQAAAGGALAVDPARLRKALADERETADAANPRERGMAFALTSRETTVLSGIASGLTNKEIGARLSITEDTVKKHVQNIIWKLRAADRTQAAVLALQLGLIEPPDQR